MRILKANSATDRRQEGPAVAVQHPRWIRDQWPARLPLGDERPEPQGVRYQTEGRTNLQDRWRQFVHPAPRCGALLTRVALLCQFGRTRLRGSVAVDRRPL